MQSMQVSVQYAESELQMNKTKVGSGERFFVLEGEDNRTTQSDARRIHAT
jgi:hypothetical protein